MDYNVKIVRDIPVPVCENVSVGKNKFSGGCSKQGPKPRPTPGCTIADIKWYPDEKKLVIVKTNAPDITVDIGALIPEEQETQKNIFIWDPIKEMRRVVVEKGTGYTDALQEIVDEIDNNFHRNFVWKEWSNEVDGQGE